MERIDDLARRVHEFGFCEMRKCLLSVYRVPKSVCRAEGTSGVFESS